MSGDADRIFFETTRRLSSPKLAQDDVELALQALRPALGAAPRIADLGCGYGRHLAAFARLGVRAIGVDRSDFLLEQAKSIAQVVRADLRALPIRGHALDAAACFYSSMFLGTDDDARAALAQAARAIKRGGLFFLTTDNPLRLAASPRARFCEDVPGLGRVTEESEYDPRAKIDTVRRSIDSAEAIFRIRYYLPAELAALGSAAGLTLLRAPLHESTPQLAALFAVR